MTAAAPATPPDEAAAAPRRRLLYGSVALAAAAGGSWAWQAMRVRPAPDDLAALWPLAFDQPGGGRLAMAGFRGKPLLVNFWATWCPPCIEELPLINAFFEANAAKSWQVVGLAVDQAAPVRQFLQKMPLSFPVGLVAGEGVALSRSLGNLSGGLPFTVLVSADGRLLQRRMGRVTAADLQQWASAG